MARRFETQYRMKNGETVLGQDYFNTIFRDVDLRIHGLEISQDSVEEAVANVVQVGLERIDETLAPALEQIEQQASLGFLTATSDSPLTFELGSKGVVINEGSQRELFAPSPWVSIYRSSTPDDIALASLTSYDNETGAFLFEIVAVVGSPGPHSDLILENSPGQAVFYQELSDRIANADAAATAAAISASEADDSASNALVSASAAQSSASAASSSAATALTRANTAEGHANTASGHASTALGHANAAQASADAAAASAAAAVQGLPTFEDLYFLSVTQ